MGSGRARVPAPRQRRLAPVALLLAAGLAGVSSLALAQDGGQGGLFAKVDFSAGLRSETGDGSDDEVAAIAGLSFGLESVTRNQVFRLRTGGDLELNGDGLDLVRPRATLAYALSSRATELSFDAAYSEVDLDQTTIEDLLTGEEINVDAGSRTTTSAALRLVTGREGPFGTDTRLEWSERDYVDTVDPDLVPSTTVRASTVLRFDVSPVVTLRLTADRERSEEDDAGNEIRTTTRVGFGADLRIDRAWTLSADLADKSIETLDTPVVPGPRVRTESSGLDAALRLGREMPNGTLSFGLRRTIEVTGHRLTFDIGRSLELREGSLEATFGLVRLAGGDVRPVASLAWNQKLTPTDQLTAALSRSATTTSDDLDAISTKLSLGYERQINQVSGLTATMGLAESDVQGGTGDQRRIDMGLGYRHALTEDWDLAAGVNHRLTYEDGVRQDSITTLTLNVGRSFLFRP